MTRLGIDLAHGRHQTGHEQLRRMDLGRSGRIATDALPRSTEAPGLAPGAVRSHWVVVPGGVLFRMPHRCHPGTCSRCSPS